MFSGRCLRHAPVDYRGKRAAAYASDPARARSHKFKPAKHNFSPANPGRCRVDCGSRSGSGQRRSDHQQPDPHDTTQQHHAAFTDANPRANRDTNAVARANLCFALGQVLYRRAVPGTGRRDQDLMGLLYLGAALVAVAAALLGLRWDLFQGMTLRHGLVLL